MKRQFTGIIILAFFLFSFSAYAGEPMNVTQVNVNKVLDVLRDPKLKPESAKEIKKQKLRTIYKNMFNEVEFSKRTLARNWDKLNAGQRKNRFLQGNHEFGKAGRNSNKSYNIFKRNSHFLQINFKRRWVESV